MYIGPGAGFAFAGSFLTLLSAFFFATLSLVTWPFRMIRMFVRGRLGYRHARVKKVIFLGLDGLDPGLTERFMAEGKLPNLSRLAAEGSYRRLRTTFPALSPVAWSTFATGVNPAKHNIFDFLNRDLRTYAPELSSSKVMPPQRTIRIGKWTIPLSRPGVQMRRKSVPFWKLLGDHAITSTILRVPITFPPEEFDGRLLSAMATPDLRGTQGSFSFFSTRADESETEGGARFPLVRDGEALKGSLKGPENTAIPFRIVNRTLEIAAERYTLRPGEYSPWIKLAFGVGPGAVAHGLVRVLLTETGADTSLYVTPIQIDPESPALPISYPAIYAAYLSKLLGPFATAGMAEDTWALNEGVIDEDAFLAQAESIKQERASMFFSALQRVRRGVVACVFDTTDRVQHMFYRYLDGRETGRYQQVIEDLYRDADRMVGDTMQHVDDSTGLFVLSDHGFCSFRRGVNLNAWLRDNGYLHLKDDATEAGKYFENVDWRRTRAYTMGLGGLYLNIAGREVHGIVSTDDAEALRQELIAKLTGLRDPETGSVAIRQVYNSSKLYKGPYLDAAPDLIIGYADGYRTSWSAAVGATSATVFEDNDKAWSGDHCVDPMLVPGVLFSNLKVDAPQPGIEDMAATALWLFGVPRPAWMEGQSVFHSA